MVNWNTLQIGARTRARQRGRILRGAAAIISGATAAVALGCTTLSPSPAVEAPMSYQVSAPDALMITILPEPGCGGSSSARTLFA